jgi:CMP-N,N'-diacetyllegionaminic acid synthase
MTRVLTIIPARGGSKGLPGKNIKIINEKPLLAYSIEQAKIVSYEHKIVVSTDCDQIGKVAIRYGAEYLKRPENLSGDTATSESALIHALNEYEKNGFNPEYICFLQCTSPIRSNIDIQNALSQIISDCSDSLLSVSPNHRFIWKIGENGPYSMNYDFKNRKRRQDLEPEYVENGSIYIFKPWVLKKNNNRLGGKVSLYLMPEESSFEIDSAFDFFIIESLMKGLK